MWDTLSGLSSGRPTRQLQTACCQITHYDHMLLMSWADTGSPYCSMAVAWSACLRHNSCQGIWLIGLKFVLQVSQSASSLRWPSKRAPLGSKALRPWIPARSALLLNPALSGWSQLDLQMLGMVYFLFMYFLFMCWHFGTSHALHSWACLPCGSACWQAKVITWEVSQDDTLITSPGLHGWA